MQTRMILVGGFLGAGKTTLLLHAGKKLAARELKVGLITNDQGQNLVDTALLSSQKFAVTEVAGGCFCCNFPHLMTAVQQLQSSVQPDVILAESVGSCTDLVATVLRPLNKYHSDQLAVAPLTVLIDPLRDVTQFDANVDYLYHQQLSEADIIGVSKSDLLSNDEVDALVTRLQTECPQAQVVALSSTAGIKLDDWLDLCLNSTSKMKNVLDIDYKIYAEAEAALGWLNTHGTLAAVGGKFSAFTWAEAVLQEIEHVARQHNILLAHVKLNIQVEDMSYKVSLTTADKPLVWDAQPTNAPVQEATFILNARAHVPPDELERMVRGALDNASRKQLTQHRLQHFECFSPLPPQPTYHIGLGEL